MNKIIILISILMFLPSVVYAGCTPGEGYLCCPSHCPKYDILTLQGTLNVIDENNNGLFDPGEKLTVIFGTVLPSCSDSVDFLNVQIGLYDNTNGNLLRNKTALYSTNGVGSNDIEYVAEIRVPEDIDTPKIEIKLTAKATAVHGSTAAKDRTPPVQEAFDSCVSEVLIQDNSLKELPLDQATIDYLKNTRDVHNLDHTINTEEIYINQYKFTLWAGSGHPFWDVSAYDLAKCLFNWEKCARRTNTECICCSNIGGHYGVEARFEQSKIYSTSQIKPHFKSLYYTGDENYFNIFWSAAYDYPSNAKLAVTCTLNNQQSCNSEHLSGLNGGCTITNPTYNFKETNTLNCTAYNPRYPTLRSTNISEFRAVDFKIWSGISFGQAFTVGQLSTLPINIQNLGLLTDKYEVNSEILSGSETSYFELPNNYITEEAKTNEIKTINAKLTLLSTNGVSIKFCANSTVHRPYCSYNNNEQEKCCQTIQIKGGLASLQDMTIMHVMLLLLISTFILLLKNKL
jgi:hypothetical protein